MICFKDSETLVTVEESYSLVLSNAKVVDNEYYVPPGQPLLFWFALVRVASKLCSGLLETMNFTQVTSLPFKIISGGKASKNQPPIPLNFNIT